MTRFGSLFLAALLMLSTSVYAEETSLEVYVNKLSEHPQILHLLSESSQSRELSLGEMGLPDPVLILGVDNLPVNNADFDSYLPSSKTFGFKQHIPNGTLRQAKSDKQQQISVKQKLVADYAKSRLKGILISNIVKLKTVRNQVALAEQQLAHYKGLENYFQGRLESGSGVYWRFSQVDVERSLVEQKLNDLKAERVEIEAELVRLVGEVPMLEFVDVAIQDWDASDDIYPVRIAREDMHVTGFDVKAADASFRSNYGVQALYKQREAGENFDGKDWFSVQATVSVPLWYSSNQAPKKRAAVAKQNAAKQFYEDVSRSWVKKMKSLESKRDSALKNVYILKNKTKALAEMVAAANRTYESGETTLDALLEAQINHLSIQSQLAEQRYKHMSLSAEINSYIGEK